jgi:hypothetical protein
MQHQANDGRVARRAKADRRGYLSTDKGTPPVWASSPTESAPAWPPIAAAIAASTSSESPAQTDALRELTPHGTPAAYPAVALSAGADLVDLEANVVEEC